MPFGDKTLPSNMTGTFFALETEFAVAPDNVGTEWWPIEPNEYSEFGSDIEKEARTPITKDRQNRKALVINETASAGYTHDMVQDTMAELMPGFMFDDWAEKTSDIVTGDADDVSADIQVDVVVISSVTTDLTALEVIPGEWFFMGGDTAASQLGAPGFYRCLIAPTANSITCDRYPAAFVDDDGTGKTVEFYVGRTLRTQPDPDDIKRHSYTFQRQLTTDQFENILGNVANTWALTMPTTGKFTAEIGMVAAKSEYTDTAAIGDFADLTEEEAYTAAMEGVEIRLLYANGADAFAFVSEATISIDNGATPTNAVGYLGAIDMSAGNFTGSAEVTAYFTHYDAIAAIKANDSVGLFLKMVAAGKGWLIDLPYVTLGGGMVNVTANEPITIPLTVNGSKHPVYGHTMIMQQFATLPAIAATISG